MGDNRIPSSEYTDFSRWWYKKYGYTANPPNTTDNAAYRQWSIEAGPLSKQQTGVTTEIAGLMLPGETPAIISEKYRAYKDTGGTLDQMGWLRGGRQSALPSEQMEKTEKITQKPPPNGQMSYTDASGTIMTWNGAEYQPTGFDPTKVYQPSKQPTEYQQWGQDPYGGQGQFNLYTGQWEAPSGWISPQEQWQRDEAGRQAAAQQGWQEQQMGWWQQQAAAQQAEQEKQYRSQLAANPKSWLEYASYTGQTPVVQPWMMPLGQKEYGWQVGEQIPGWNANNMQNLPDLYRPSAQLWARMGPTAQSQYYGYQQGNLGSSPEETEFRRRSTAAPGGSYTPLRWSKY